MTSVNVQSLLEKSMDAHDVTLHKSGQLGKTHRCHGEPFYRNQSMVETHLSDENAAQLTFNVTDLPYFESSIPISSYIPFGKNEIMLEDKLCSGGQVTVIKSLNPIAFIK